MTCTYYRIAQAGVLDVTLNMHCYMYVYIMTFIILKLHFMTIHDL